MGVGDPFGIEAAHALSSGMGGIRTAGDLVLRMQLAKGMKIDAAKKYVAEKLGVSVIELSDVITMTEVREKLGLTIQIPYLGQPVGMDAKFRIAELLGIKINCVEKFKIRAGIK